MTRLEDGEGDVYGEDTLAALGRDLAAWRSVWREDRTFPIRSHRGRLLGRLLVAFKRLLRPLVRAPQADLWERQRVFNLVALDRLEELDAALEALGKDVSRIGTDLQQVQAEIVADLRRIQGELGADLERLATDLDAFKRKGMVDVMRHADALFARLDQKVDRLGRLTRSLQTAGSERAPTP